jgi:peroxiredoxin
MLRNWKPFAGMLLLLVVAVVLAGCTGPGQEAPGGINVGNRARDFTLEDLAGDKVSLSDYRGDVVLINFWATWCPPCRAEIPDLEAAYRTWGGNGLVVLGLSTDESREQVQAFVDEFGVTYPVLLDSEAKIMQTYRARGLPTSVLVDRDGVIQVRHIGYLAAEQLNDYLAQVMP